MLNHSLKIGFSFGLTSGVITTLGLMVGLFSGTSSFPLEQSKLAVMGGILTIAIADSLSDAAGIHISEESENRHTTKEIWQSTLATFISKFIFGLTFVIPILLFNELKTAIIVSIMWGLSLLCILSFFIAPKKNKKRIKAIAEHLLIAVIVIILTFQIGCWISSFCGNIL